ncbi:MAG TPA: hypothetical protein VJ862_04960 [Rhodanobacteraceae bacterium]|nr:hypothetical protein [Rhodanobacteraceae bacterium]
MYTMIIAAPSIARRRPAGAPTSITSMRGGLRRFASHPEIRPEQHHRRHRQREEHDRNVVDAAHMERAHRDRAERGDAHPHETEHRGRGTRIVPERRDGLGGAHRHGQPDSDERDSDRQEVGREVALAAHEQRDQHQEDRAREDESESATDDREVRHARRQPCARTGSDHERDEDRDRDDHDRAATLVQHVDHEVRRTDQRCIHDPDAQAAHRDVEQEAAGPEHFARVAPQALALECPRVRLAQGFRQPAPDRRGERERHREQQCKIRMPPECVRDVGPGDGTDRRCHRERRVDLGVHALSPLGGEGIAHHRIGNDAARTGADALDEAAADQRRDREAEHAQERTGGQHQRAEQHHRPPAESVRSGPEHQLAQGRGPEIRGHGELDHPVVCVERSGHRGHGRRVLGVAERAGRHHEREQPERGGRGFSRSTGCGDHQWRAIAVASNGT